MYRIKFPLKLIIISISLLITSCLMNVEDLAENSLSIEWIDIDYNQNDTTLFLQVEVIPENKMITEVFVEISSENFDSTIFLNDNGDFGDLIPQNNIFSSFTEKSIIEPSFNVSTSKMSEYLHFLSSIPPALVTNGLLPAHNAFDKEIQQVSG